MLRIIKVISPILVILLLSGCATHSDKIQADYVSPMEYQDYSCHQLREELMRVSRKVNQVAGVQDKTATDDSWATGVGVVVFWPALFFIAHNDDHVELAQLKGDYDAVTEEAIKKNCDIAKQIKVARKEAKKREEKKKKEMAAQAKQSTLNQ